MLNCTPVFACSPCSYVQVCSGKDRKTHVCLFDIISLTCLNPAVHFFKKVNFFSMSFHSSASLIPPPTRTHKHGKSPLHPPVSPPFFCFMSLRHGRKSRDSCQIPPLHIIIHTLCWNSDSITHSFLTAHIVAPLSFQRAPSLPLAFFLPANSLFLPARRWDKGRKADNISCCIGLFISLCRLPHSIFSSFGYICRAVAPDLEPKRSDGGAAVPGSTPTINGPRMNTKWLWGWKEGRNFTLSLRARQLGTFS